MKKVNKFPVPRRSKGFELLLPAGFKFLKLTFQDENLYMWVEVPDESAPKSICRFGNYGTNQEIPDGAQHLESYEDGPFVIHVYRL